MHHRSNIISIILNKMRGCFNLNTSICDIGLFNIFIIQSPTHFHVWGRYFWLLIGYRFVAAPPPLGILLPPCSTLHSPKQYVYRSHVHRNRFTLFPTKMTIAPTLSTNSCKPLYSTWYQWPWSQTFLTTSLQRSISSHTQENFPLLTSNTLLSTLIGLPTAEERANKILSS